MSSESRRLDSICVYCGSSDAADPDFLTDAARFGKALAADGRRLVYGGGGVGLMGACAKSAHEAGGKVLGVIPEFLISKERAYDDVETIVVESMHQRKMILIEEADAFVVLPGGIGTLEEIIELLSWRRLDLVAKPIVFFNPRNFWAPLFELFDHTVRARFTPPEFSQAWRVAQAVEEILPLLDDMAINGAGPAMHPELADRT